MAIKNYKTGEETYVGRVLSVNTTCRRVMSDIYADVTTATVVDDNGSLKAVAISYGFECCSLTLHAEVDVQPYWKKLAQAWSQMCSIKNELATASSRMECEVVNARFDIKRDTTRLRKGDCLVVTRKGKGNANGDSGVVFWVGTDRFSGKTRYGFKTDSGETRWISAGSCRNVSVSADDTKKAMDEAEAAIRNKYAERAACAKEELVAAEAHYEFVNSHLREFLAVSAMCDSIGAAG